MPSGTRELGGPVESRMCRRVGCAYHICMTTAGYELPFCAIDVRLLTLRTFRRLVAISSRSVFDIDAVSEAAVIVAGARLELRTKLTKPPRAAKRR